ncbi:FAD-dependent oxidoreductase [Pseudarthrobacter sp. N5]|uniref:FAD-dependent oxidoreductase n=1 Tax=Pseudarthrobacter sp. N5 TaxID=3418416 RepID=UPI003CF87A86
MAPSTTVVDVVIVGGGPVGLYIAALLLQNGVSVRILEQRLTRNPHSRAIGIHPPALAALDQAGVAQPLIADGVAIRRGIAVSGGKQLAEMPFASVSPRFPFVLSVPQTRTEAVLERRVLALDADALLRGARVMDMHDDGGRVTFDVASAEGNRKLSGTLAIGADGSRSTVRSLLGIAATVKEYPDHYVMGDFHDSSGYGDDAALFLEGAGIVESFPLPGSVRRWVVRLDRALQAADATRLAGLVQERTGVSVESGTNTMLSRFSVRSCTSRSMVLGRTALIGDAAHEISPIGGQGMNLGWLDAAELAPLIIGALAGLPVGQGLRSFDCERRQAAARAVWQSEVNMMLGRPLPHTLLTARNIGIRRLADIPAVNRLIARRFTMQ